ncbi:MAG: hypothetical protein ACXAD7_09710 [Candidatus Kariarchaeaceae archaeon]|jgi:hypothetical protein
MENIDSEEFLEHLVKIAKSDGVVTDDEKNFIDAVEKDINAYKDELNKFVHSGKINQSEKLSLYHSRMRIVRKAIDTAMTDYEFTNDEQKLFSGLKSKLKELEELEKELQ